jgi:hypothetical protein
MLGLSALFENPARIEAEVAVTALSAFLWVLFYGLDNWT